MTKSELAAKVAEKTGMTKKNASAAVEAVFETITESLSNGEKVSIVGFGSFEAKERAGRTCINPSTKEKVDVAASRVPKFTAGKALKDSVAE